MRVIVAALAAMLAFLAVPVAAQAQDDPAIRTAQLEDLTSLREIQRVQAAVGHLAVGGRWANIGTFFTDDALLDWGHGEVQGREAIVAHLRRQQGAGADRMAAGRLNLHLFFNPAIALSADGQGASGTWREVAMMTAAGGISQWRVGQLDVAYRREAEGWRIASMRLAPSHAGTYAEVLASGASPAELTPFGAVPERAPAPLPRRTSATPMTSQQIGRQATLLLGAEQAQFLIDQLVRDIIEGRANAAADLFAEDSTIRVRGQGRWIGRDGARRYFARFRGANSGTGVIDRRRQLMPLAIIGGSGNAVVINTVELGMTGGSDGGGYWSAALVDYRILRGEDGLWSIAAMQRVPLMRASLATGWGEPLPAEAPLVSGGEPDYAVPAQVGFEQVDTVVMPAGLSLLAPSRDEDVVWLIPGALDTLAQLSGYSLP